MVELYISSCCCFVQSSNAEYLSKSEIEDQNGCRGGPQPASDGEEFCFFPAPGSWSKLSETGEGLA